jgi:hypothetical protein
MASEFLRQYAVGGATRPDSFTNLSPEFQSSLAALFQGAPPEVQSTLRVSSGFRSPDRQAQLWQAALAKYGSDEAARKWVAPPGRSKHNHGQAVDLKFLNPAAQQWVHANAKQYGLHFPMAHENWHIEPIGARGGAQPMQPGNALPMMAQAGAPQPTTPGFQMADPAAAAAAAPLLANTVSPIAAMFAADAEQQKRRQEEAATEQARRNALFGGPSPFG